MPPVGFESTIQANARPQTYAIDRAATGIGGMLVQDLKINGAIVAPDSQLRAFAMPCC
jgi:hypothetical protein